MKTFTKIAAIFFAIAFSFLSLIIILIGEVGFGIFLLLSGLLFSFVIYSSGKNYKKRLSLRDKQIRGLGFQFLESLYSIHKTKSKNVLLGRIKFINKIYPELTRWSSSKKYIENIKYSISEYTTLYPKRPLSDVDFDILLNPNREKLKEICKNAIVRLNA